MSNITITPAEGTWVVRAGGAVLGESSAALELRESGYPPVIYFPRGDIATAFLEPSEKSTTCPHKGAARHFSIVTPANTLDDAVWTYETPIDDVAAIAGHLAFYASDTVTIEQL